MTQKDPFQGTVNGEAVQSFVLQNASGMRCRILNYGARVVDVFAPDRAGNLDDVVLGHDNLTDYLKYPETFFGATVGRVANRTGGAQFKLDGKRYPLSANDGKNHIHGGPKGFHNRVWTAVEFDETRVVLSLHSPHGEEGYPGAIDVVVTYALGEDNALKITFEARTDRNTPVNITNHSYFNLKNSGNVEDHVFRIHADTYLPVKADLTPVGTAERVAGSPFDFRTPKKLSGQLAKSHEQLELGNGFDHNFIPNGSGLRLVAEAQEPTSGRKLSVFTDSAGVQFYTGNALGRGFPLKGGKRSVFRSGFCFETQGFPDSLNHNSFPSIVLKSGDIYRHTCIYQFGIES